MFDTVLSSGSGNRTHFMIWKMTITTIENTFSVAMERLCKWCNPRELFWMSLMVRFNSGRWSLVFSGSGLFVNGTLQLLAIASSCRWANRRTNSKDSRNAHSEIFYRPESPAVKKHSRVTEGAEGGPRKASWVGAWDRLWKTEMTAIKIMCQVFYFHRLWCVC